MIIDGVDTDTLTDAQIREMALAAVSDPASDPQPQPRDDQGRFVAPVEDPADSQDDPPTDPEPQEFVRTIDLGDGAGVQVFRGATAEEVADKLVEAQRNATRKIRSDNQQIKTLTERLASFEEQRAAKPLTEDERFLLSQKFLTDPVAAQQEVLERMGLNPTKLKKAVQALDQQEVVSNNVAVFQQWITGNPDFVDTESNGRKIGNYIQRFHNGIATTAAIEEAYKNLKADGLLQEKAGPSPTPAPTGRRSSGLPLRNSVPRPVPVAEDPYALPMEELKRRANGGKDFGGW